MTLLKFRVRQECQRLDPSPSPPNIYIQKFLFQQFEISNPTEGSICVEWSGLSLLEPIGVICAFVVQTSTPTGKAGQACNTVQGCSTRKDILPSAFRPVSAVPVLSVRIKSGFITTCNDHHCVQLNFLMITIVCMIVCASFQLQLETQYGTIWHVTSGWTYRILRINSKDHAQKSNRLQKIPNWPKSEMSLKRSTTAHSKISRQQRCQSGQTISLSSMRM